MILCAARMFTLYNGQRRASATGGAVAAPLVLYKYLVPTAVDLEVALTALYYCRCVVPGTNK